jgi:hypothetical protein
MALPHWVCGASTEEKREHGVEGLIQAFRHLKGEGMTGAHVVAIFHHQRVLPLMNREQSLVKMVPDVPWVGMMLSPEPINDEEVLKPFKEAFGSILERCLLTNCPPMRPEDGFAGLMSDLFSLELL